jgi:hypothetical protein
MGGLAREGVAINVERVSVNSDDSQQVLEVAGLLDISEFRLFQLAFASWYGHAPDRYSLEWEFEAYMFYQKVPFWVRHFCREVIGQEQMGQFDPERIGVHPSPGNRRSLLMGIIFAIVPIIVLLTLLLLGYSSPESVAQRGCITPPCFSEITQSKE